MTIVPRCSTFVPGKNGHGWVEKATGRVLPASEAWARRYEEIDWLQRSVCHRCGDTKELHAFEVVERFHPSGPFLLGAPVIEEVRQCSQA